MCKENSNTGASGEASFVYNGFLNPNTIQYFRLGAEHFSTSEAITLSVSPLFKKQTYLTVPQNQLQTRSWWLVGLFFQPEKSKIQKLKMINKAMLEERFNIMSDQIRYNYRNKEHHEKYLFPLSNQIFYAWNQERKH